MNVKVKKILLVAVVFLLLSACAGMADYDVDLPSDYWVIRSSAHNIIILRGDGTLFEETLVPAKVTQIGWDEKFIVANQVSLQKESNESDYLIPNEKDMHYWIINYKTDEIMGPLDENQFLERKSELQIPENLKLTDVSKLRKS